MITSHPTGTKYYCSRQAARDNCRGDEKVVRLGRFQTGSFGVYKTGNCRGDDLIIVWAVMPRSTREPGDRK